MLLGLFLKPLLNISRITQNAREDLWMLVLLFENGRWTPGLHGSPVLSVAVNGPCRRIRAEGPSSPSELLTVALDTCSVPEWLTTGAQALLPSSSLLYVLDTHTHSLSVNYNWCSFQAFCWSQMPACLCKARASGVHLSVCRCEEQPDHRVRVLTFFL